MRQVSVAGTKRRGRPPRPQMVGYDWSQKVPSFGPRPFESQQVPFGMSLFELMFLKVARKIGKKAQADLLSKSRTDDQTLDRTAQARFAWLETQGVGLALAAIERHGVALRRADDPFWPGALSEARARELVWASSVLAFQRDSAAFKRAVVKEVRRDPTIADRSQRDLLVSVLKSADMADLRHERGRRTMPKSTPAADDDL